MKHTYGYSVTKIIGGTVYVEAETPQDALGILIDNGIKDKDVVKDANDFLTEDWEICEVVEVDGKDVN
jgi:hypothetical protein